VLIGRGQGKGTLKSATAINVRHILCEKHSKAIEALQRIQVRYRSANGSHHRDYLSMCDLFLVVVPSGR